MKERAVGNVTVLPRREMLDLVVIDGVARGIVTRNLHPNNKLNYCMFDGHIAVLTYEQTMGTSNYYYPAGMWTWGDD